MLYKHSGPCLPVGSSYRLFLGERGKLNAFLWKKGNTARSRLKNVTAVSTESVATQIHNLHKRSVTKYVIHLIYIKKKTQNN
jgi:hypothetical protein